MNYKIFNTADKVYPCIAAVVCMVILLIPQTSWAQRQYRQSATNSQKNEAGKKTQLRIDPPLEKATGNMTVRQNAISAITQMKMTSENAARVGAVLQNISVYRRLPLYKISCDGEMIQFLVNNPDVVVNVWDKMGISQISVRQSGAGMFNVADVAGTQGIMLNVWSSENGVLYYMEGGYRGNLLARHVRGKALILARFAVEKDASGIEQTTCYIDTFLSLEQEFYDAATKLLFPMLGKVADNNLEQTLAFVNWYSDGCKRSPFNMAAFAMELTNVQPEVRRELAKQTFNTARKNGYDFEGIALAEDNPQPVPVPSPTSVTQPGKIEQIPVRVSYPPVGSGYNIQSGE